MDFQDRHLLYPDNLQKEVKKINRIYLFYFSRIFCVQFDLLFDKHTLDFLILRLHTGMCGKIQHEQWKGGERIYKCYGVIFQIQVWFIHFEIIFTPVCVKQKKKDNG